jgi:hypothetical protein
MQDSIQRQTSAILEQVKRIVVDLLTQRGHALAAPVVARFQMNERANTGVAIEVKLADPSGADDARGAIVEHFGGVAPHDRIDVY